MTITLLDIAKRNGSDAATGLIDEAMTTHPEVSGMTFNSRGEMIAIPGVGDARTIQGLQYKTLIRTVNPTVSFRNANEGVVATKGQYENRLVSTYPLNPRWNADVAVADASEDGPEAVMADEADAHTQAAFATLGKVFYYGNAAAQGQLVGDAKGFPGLINAYDVTNMEVDAGGTTNTTASSVWAVKFGRKYVRWVYGQNGQINLTDIDIRDVLDASSNPYSAYHQELLAYAGLQIGNLKAVGRIRDLTEDSGKTLTDDMISDLLAKFPPHLRPDVLFMTTRSRSQLQKSRTATNTTGSPAPIPDESFGVPIAVTESIRDTETIA